MGFTGLTAVNLGSVAPVVRAHLLTYPAGPPSASYAVLGCFPTRMNVRSELLSGLDHEIICTYIEPGNFSYSTKIDYIILA